MPLFGFTTAAISLVVFMFLRPRVVVDAVCSKIIGGSAVAVCLFKYCKLAKISQ